jgi:outer membrane protein OmpA-like peptidoglycan-associated protein
MRHKVIFVPLYKGETMKYFRLLTVGIFLLGSLVAGKANALNVQALYPSNGNTAGFSVLTSETLPQYYVSLGLHFNYVHHPLELGNVNNDPRIRGIVDRFITSNFIANIGLMDQLNLSIDMPVNLYHNIAPILIATRDTGSFDAGDLKVSLKFRALDANESKGNWGLAFVPFVTLPTGDSTIHFGDSSVTGGAVVAVEKKIKENRLYANVGTQFRERENLIGLNVQHKFLFGVGLQRPLIKSHDIDVIVELQGSTLFRKFFNEEVTTPIEGNAILQKSWLDSKNLVTYVGAGTGLTNGYSSPDFRVNTGISYAFSLEPKDRPKPELFVFQTVHFPSDSSRFYAKHRKFLDDVVAYWNKRKQPLIRVRGHTDDQGSMDYNIKLANRRCNAVMKSLIKRGVAEDKIIIETLGEDEPQNNNDTADGRQGNRRVEILFAK